MMDKPEHQDHALVILRLMNGNKASTVHPERRIFLSKNKPLMPVGRSRTGKRNPDLAASPTNLYFNFPVISRNHATIQLDAEKQEVLLQDTDSLHGTFVNKKSVTEKTPIKSGDTIQLGVDIDRITNIYPACELKAEIMYYSAARPAKFVATYSVPDDSDMEDSISDEANKDIAGVTVSPLEYNPRPASTSPDPTKTISDSEDSQDLVEQQQLPIIQSTELNTTNANDLAMSHKLALTELLATPGDRTEDGWFSTGLGSPLESERDEYSPLPVDLEKGYAGAEDSEANVSDSGSILSYGCSSLPSLGASVGGPYSDCDSDCDSECSGCPSSSDGGLFDLEHDHRNDTIHPFKPDGFEVAPMRPTHLPSTHPASGVNFGPSRCPTPGLQGKRAFFTGASSKNHDSIAILKAVVSMRPNKLGENMEQETDLKQNSLKAHANAVDLGFRQPNSSSSFESSFESYCDEAASGISTSFNAHTSRLSAMTLLAQAEKEKEKELERGQRASTPSLKRKSDGISQLNAEEQKNEDEGTEANTRVDDEAADVASNPSLDMQRPPKRLRRVAEAFGYATLGGIAVITALIATAPSL